MPVPDSLVRVMKRMHEKKDQADTDTLTADRTILKRMLLDSFLRKQVPPRFVEASPRQVPQVKPELCDLEGVFFPGPPGIGKTYAAAALTRLYFWIKTEPVRRMEDAKFWYPPKWLAWTTAARLMSRIHSTYGRKGGETQEEIIRECVIAKVLVLDDLGAVKTTEHAAEIIQRVLNDRDDAKRYTIVTSNLDHSEIERWRPGIASRLGRMRTVWLPDRERRIARTH